MTTYTGGILTISDKGSRGEREDTSGPQLREMLEAEGFAVAACLIVPDEVELIRETIRKWADEDRLDLILTTGGTGVSPRDRTPEATRPLLDVELPGFGEAMRMASLKKTPNAILSRGIAGIRKECLIINLPGSRKAAKENLEVVLPALTHAIYKLKGGERDCVP